MSIYEDKAASVRSNEYDNVRTYVFNVEEAMPGLSNEIRSKIWQIFPSLCGCSLCIIFGIMLGWPSPTYPKLFKYATPIAISYDQSALIAGFLMIGTIFSIPVSSFSPFGTKYGLLLSFILMTAGWLVMWQSKNFYWFLASRFLVGFGNGYGMGQLKQYIKDLCEPNLAKKLTKLVNITLVIGILIAFSVGPFVNFRLFCIISLFITVICFCFCMFIPHTPIELIRFGKIGQAKRIIHYLRPTVNADIETQKMKISLEDKPEHMSIFQVFRSKMLRKNFVLLMFLVFFQQFTGPPATIVYCQFMFEKLGCPHAEILAIIYIIIFFFSNILAYFHMDRYNNKYCLAFSSFTVSILLLLNVLVIYYNFSQKWNLCSFFIMAVFIFFHTIGLGTVPFYITEKLFPTSGLKIVVHIQLIVYSALAIIVTKIFQVLFTRYLFYIPFMMFTLVSVLSTLFILIFIPYKLPVLHPKNSSSIPENI